MPCCGGHSARFLRFPSSTPITYLTEWHHVVGCGYCFLVGAAQSQLPMLGLHAQHLPGQAQTDPRGCPCPCKASHAQHLPNLCHPMHCLSDALFPPCSVVGQVFLALQTPSKSAGKPLCRLPASACFRCCGVALRRVAALYLEVAGPSVNFNYLPRCACSCRSLLLEASGIFYCSCMAAHW